MELSASDHVWNRACEVNNWPPVFEESTPEGDQHLHYMVMFDSFAQGDGLVDALSHMGSDGTRKAIEAFRWFGIPEPADVVQNAWDKLIPQGVEWSHEDDLSFDVLHIDDLSDEELENLDTEGFDAEYYSAAEGLNNRFDSFFASHPDWFSPVS